MATVPRLLWRWLCGLILPTPPDPPVPGAQALEFIRTLVEHEQPTGCILRNFTIRVSSIDEEFLQAVRAIVWPHGFRFRVNDQGGNGKVLIIWNAIQ